MKPSWRKIKNELSTLIIDGKKVHYVLACSGGVDSMFLWDFMEQALDGPFSVFHYDHNISEYGTRATEIVKKFESLKPHRRVNCFKNEEPITPPNLELKAREARWEALETFVDSLVKDNPGVQPVIVTAHHLDDNIEQALMRFVFGASESIVMKRLAKVGNFYRYKPLLEVPKESILEQARKKNLMWIDDPTNFETCSTRNKFRNEVLPALARIGNYRKTMSKRIGTLA